MAEISREYTGSNTLVFAQTATLSQFLSRLLLELVETIEEF